MFVFFQFYSQLDKLCSIYNNIIYGHDIKIPKDSFSNLHLEPIIDNIEVSTSIDYINIFNNESNIVDNIEDITYITLLNGEMIRIYDNGIINIKSEYFNNVNGMYLLNKKGLHFYGIGENSILNTIINDNKNNNLNYNNLNYEGYYINFNNKNFNIKFASKGSIDITKKLKGLTIFDIDNLYTSNS